MQSDLEDQVFANYGGTDVSSPLLMGLAALRTGTHALTPLYSPNFHPLTHLGYETYSRSESSTGVPPLEPTSPRTSLHAVLTLYSNFLFEKIKHKVSGRVATVRKGGIKFAVAFKLSS